MTFLSILGRSKQANMLCVSKDVLKYDDDVDADKRPIEMERRILRDYMVYLRTNNVCNLISRETENTRIAS
jgi:hypothetical protein